MASYYDLDDILTDAQKVPCVFDLDVPVIGAVVSAQAAAPSVAMGPDGKPTTKQRDPNTVPEGSKAELPLWLGWMLAVNPNLATGRGFVSLQFPESLSTHVINALRANPLSVDIRSLAPQFYALGARMLELFDEEELSTILTDSFRDRAKEISDKAYNPKGALGDGTEFLRGLDDSERKLFRAAHEGVKAVRAWQITGSKKW